MKTDPILNTKEVILILGISESTIRRLEAVKRFPVRIRISVRRYGYRQSEIEQYIESRREQS